MLDCKYCSEVQEVKQPAEDLSNLLKVLNEQMDVWLEEHSSLGISNERKQHLWHIHLLPTERERLRILHELTRKEESLTIS